MLLLWLMTRARTWVEITHLAIRLFAFLVFALTLLVLRGGSARMLGIAFAGAILIAAAASQEPPDATRLSRLDPDKGKHSNER